MSEQVSPEAIIQEWELLEGESMREGHRATLERLIGAALHSRDERIRALQEIEGLRDEIRLLVLARDIAESALAAARADAQQWLGTEPDSAAPDLERERAEREAAVRDVGDAHGFVAELRGRVLALCDRRGWSLHWTHRSAYLHLEAAELTEAVRGKRGSTLRESADVLITLLALSPHELQEIIEAAHAKVDELWDKPVYAGEEHSAALRASRQPATPAPEVNRACYYPQADSFLCATHGRERRPGGMRCDSPLAPFVHVPTGEEIKRWGPTGLPGSAPTEEPLPPADESVACPSCGSQPGERCVAFGGDWARYPHAARVKLVATTSGPSEGPPSAPAPQGACEHCGGRGKLTIMVNGLADGEGICPWCALPSEPPAPVPQGSPAGAERESLVEDSDD